MMKTPDEIKKGLECHIGDAACTECPYDILAPGACSGTLCKDTLAYIQQLEAQVPKWISVEERLPETRDWVLVIGKFVPEGGWFVPHIAEYYLGNWRLDDERCSNPEDLLIKVTHWMPLPEPPKEDDHAD